MQESRSKTAIAFTKRVFGKDGAYTEEVLEKGHHYVEVALDEVPLFIRAGKCIPVAKAAQCVAQIDTAHLELLGFEGAEYILYEDDGIHKDYNHPSNQRNLK